MKMIAATAAALMMAASAAFGGEQDPRYFDMIDRVFSEHGEAPYEFGDDGGAVPCVVRLCSYRGDDGSETELFGVRTAELGEDGIVAVVRSAGHEAIELVGVEWSSELEPPELRAASPSGGRQSEMLLRSPLVDADGRRAEALTLIRAEMHSDGLGSFASSTFSASEALAAAGELVAIKTDGSTAAISARGGGRLLSIEGDRPLGSSALAGEVRYLFGADGGARLRITPVLRYSETSGDASPELRAPREIELTVRISDARTEDDPLFLLSAPRAAKDGE